MNIRKAIIDDLSRVAEIYVFNNRMNFFPIFKDESFSFGELQVVSLVNNYFKKDEIITTYIAKRNQICILISGSADLVRYDSNGNKTIVEHFTSNDIFGEIFYTIATNNELFVKARHNSEVLFFSYDLMKHKCKTNCAFHKIFQEHRLF